MRLTRIAATTLIAGSLTFAGSGLALADTVTATPAASVTSVVAQSGGTITLGSSSVKPGSSVSLSGRFAEPSTGPISVTSPAFAGPATLNSDGPTGFAGFAQIASSAKPGSYTVTATQGGRTATGTVTVTGSTPPPQPHHGGTGTGTHTSGHGSSSGTQSGTDTSSSDLTAITDASGADALPWVLGGAGVIVLIGGGAYALGRGRSADRAVEARQQYRDPRTEVMTRR